VKRLFIGSRGSRLALLQAQAVMAKINALDSKYDLVLCKIATSGDKDKRTQLVNLGTAAFVKELEEALLDGRIDIAVHSLKDMPTRLPDGLCLTAVTERADPRDTLTSRACLADLPDGSTIATGSLRREVQLASFRPGLRTCNIRGNIETRLRKVNDGQADGLIMAAAALIRLGWQDRIREYLPLEHFLPAAGQGAIVIEARDGDRDIIRLTSRLNDIESWQAVTAERAFLHALGGGCRAPIAALGTVSGEILKLEGMVAGISSKRVMRNSIVGRASEATETGELLAAQVLDMGAASLIAEASGK